MIVEDVEQATEELHEILGVHWGRIQRKTLTIETPTGPAPTDMCYSYSVDGPPYLEVIEQRPRTAFEMLGLHHIGVWTDDPPAESARLDAIGCPRETVVIKPDGTWGGGLFHVASCGLRVEMVDISRSGPRLIHYLNGGDY
jgi:hypothetical protein